MLVYIQSLITRKLVEHFASLKKVNCNETCSKILEASTQRVFFLSPRSLRPIQAMWCRGRTKRRTQLPALIQGPVQWLCHLSSKASEFSTAFSGGSQVVVRKWNVYFHPIILSKVHSCSLRQLYENLGNVGSL